MIKFNFQLKLSYLQGLHEKMKITANGLFTIDLYTCHSVIKLKSNLNLKRKYFVYFSIKHDTFQLTSGAVMQVVVYTQFYYNSL